VRKGKSFLPEFILQLLGSDLKMRKGKGREAEDHLSSSEKAYGSGEKHSLKGSAEFKRLLLWHQFFILMRLYYFCN